MGFSLHATTKDGKTKYGELVLPLVEEELKTKASHEDEMLFKT